MRIRPAINHPGRQQGVALISVLLVFALVVIVAGEMMSRNYRDIRKTANLINAKQAYHFALSGEQFARQILYRDHSDGTSDTLRDSWAVELDTFDIENGSMTIDIIDLQSRFNINNLITGNGNINRAAAARFRRLLSVLDIKQDYTPVLIDWLDRDDIQSGNGAEDSDYLADDYLAANTAIADRSELRLLKGLRFEDYEIIKDYIVALPKAVKDKPLGTTKYNLNTLDAKLVEVLASDSGNTTGRITQRQKQGGYNSLATWMNNEGKVLRNNQQLLTITSAFFEVVVTAIVNERVSVIRTQLHRDGDGSITVLKRQQGFE